RHYLQLQRDFFELDARRDRRYSIYSSRIRQGIDRNWNLRARRDNCLFVVTRENGRPRNHFEPAGGLKQMHNRGERIASSYINIRAAPYILNDLTEVDQVGRIDNTR